MGLRVPYTGQQVPYFDPRNLVISGYDDETFDPRNLAISGYTPPPTPATPRYTPRPMNPGNAAFLEGLREDDRSEQAERNRENVEAMKRFQRTREASRVAKEYEARARGEGIVLPGNRPPYFAEAGQPIAFEEKQYVLSPPPSPTWGGMPTDRPLSPEEQAYQGMLRKRYSSNPRTGITYEPGE